MNEALGYAQWLRAHIGHSMLIVPGASGVIRDNSGRVLLQRRRDFGTWGLPGGGMDLGETIADTARREVREEVGLQVQPKRLVGLTTDPRVEVVFPNGDQVQPFGALFECEVVGGKLEKQEAEVLDLGWFESTDPPPMTPIAARWLERLGGYQGQAFFDPPVTTLPRADHEGPPDHIRRLREVVGHAPLIATGAAGCIRDDRGRVLLQKRRDNHLWGFPGGMQELGESIAATVCRETEEEVGLQVEPTQLIGLYTSPEFGRTYDNGDQVQMFIVFFELALRGGNLRAQESEVLEIDWFDLDHLPPMQPCCAAKAADARIFQGEAFIR